MLKSAILLLLLLGSAAAQTRTLTLDQAIDLALANSPALKAARTQIDQNQAQEITAKLRPNPVLQGDAQFLPIFNPNSFSFANFDQTQQYDLGIGYLFERGGKRQRRLQAARDETEITRLQVCEAERNLAFSVAQQFIAALLGKGTNHFVSNSDGGRVALFLGKVQLSALRLLLDSQIESPPQEGSQGGAVGVSRRRSNSFDAGAADS